MKIDTSKIVGFDEMSDSEKLEALQNYEVEVPDNSAEISKYKEIISKANSEAARYKKQLNERPSNDDLTNLKTELETLKRDKTIADYKAQYLALGYPDELANTTAIAMADGDTTTVFNSQKVFKESMLAEFEKQKVATIPTPASGKPINDIESEKAEMNKLRMYAGLPPI